jgi:hypothetical protein
MEDYDEKIMVSGSGGTSGGQRSFRGHDPEVDGGLGQPQ